MQITGFQIDHIRAAAKNATQGEVQVRIDSEVCQSSSQDFKCTQGLFSSIKVVIVVGCRTV